MNHRKIAAHLVAYLGLALMAIAGFMLIGMTEPGITPELRAQRLITGIYLIFVGFAAMVPFLTLKE